MQSSARHHVILIAVCSVTYFINLGGTHLWDEDEAYFGRTTHEMRERNDLIVPFFNGEVSLHKPAFMYWVMSGSFELFGESEFAARFGSAVFGIMNVLVLYHIGRLLFSASVGLWSGLALGTCLHFSVIARAAVSDQQLLLFCTLPILIFISGSRLNRGGQPPDSDRVRPIDPREVSWQYWALAYTAMGVGVLVKGPVAAVLPTAVLGLFLLMSRADDRRRTEQLAQSELPAENWKRRLAWCGLLFRPLVFLKTTWQMRPLTALAMIAVVALPWYVAVGLATDGEWLHGFFFVHNVGRFSRSFEGHAGGLLYYVVAICIGTYPWCIFMYQSLKTMVNDSRPGDEFRSAYLLLISWVCVWVGAFTMASTKLPHYVLPAYPAIALVLGRFVDKWLQGTCEVGHKWLRAAWMNLIVVGVVLLIAVPLITRRYLPGEEVLALIGLVPLLGGIVALWAEERGRRPVAAIALVTTASLLVLVSLAWGAVRVDRYQHSVVVADWLTELDAPGRKVMVGTYGCSDASLNYYCQRPLDELAGLNELSGYLDQEGRRLVLTTDSELQMLPNGLPPGVEVLKSTPRFMRDGKLVLLGRTESAPVGDGDNLRISELPESATRQ